MSLDSDSKVHINKSISVLGIIQLIVIVVGFGVAYGAVSTEIEVIKKDVSGTVDKETLVQMFKVKEIQIENIDNKVESIDGKVEKVDSKVEKLNEKLDKIQLLLIEIAKKQPD